VYLHASIFTVNSLQFTKYTFTGLNTHPESVPPQYMASCHRNLQLLKLGIRSYASGGHLVGRFHISAYSCTYSYPYSVPVDVVSSEIQ
jgi:hypothetical protein